MVYINTVREFTWGIEAQHSIGVVPAQITKHHARESSQDTV